MSFFHAEDEIVVCNRHQEDVPLIWTFAFNGAEFWCPACGAQYGMLGAGRDVKWTPRLQNKLAFYKEKSRQYLEANSRLHCSSLKHKGKWIKFNELPKKSKEYWIKKSKEWEYKYP